MDSSRHSRSRAADVPLYCFWLAALLYVLNVLLGKYSASLPSFAGAVVLGDVGQFVLMLLVSAFLVAAALVHEARRQSDQGQSDPGQSDRGQMDQGQSDQGQSNNKRATTDNESE